MKSLPKALENMERARHQGNLQDFLDAQDEAMRIARAEVDRAEDARPSVWEFKEKLIVFGIVTWKVVILFPALGIGLVAALVTRNRANFYKTVDYIMGAKVGL